MGPGPCCERCGKPMRAPRPSGLCLTCEYRARNPLAADTLAEDGRATAPFTPPAPATGTAPLQGRTARLSFSAPAPLPYAPSEVLGSIQDYDLLEELGRGGMGVVYRAFSRRLGRFVALKVIRSGDRATEIEIARFINEAMLAARLNHPNIVRIYDSGVTPEGLSYFVMELVAGHDLAHYLERGLALDAPSGGDALTVRQALEAVEKVARALEYAHAQGVVHRDVKPENILLDAAFEPHVTDFGIAKGLHEDRVELTTAGNIMGSPHYMSPEQANGETAVGPRSDVYSLGATLYHVVSGRTLFQGPTPMSILVQVLGAEPPRPSAVARALGRPPPPLDLETLCLKAIEKEADRRYPSAGELAGDLRRFLDGEPIRARPVGALERAAKKLRKNRRVLIGAFAAVLLVLTLGAAFSVSLFDNIDRSSDSIQEIDRAQSIAQARTLERAIRVNMLQGRADLARVLVGRLSRDPEVGSIEVARIDRVPAYSDRKTRRQVEQRLARPEVIDQVRKEFPELLGDIDELRRRAFPNIDRSPSEVRRPVEVDPERWRQALRAQKPVTYVEAHPRGRRLVVLKPIESSPKCQVCHGAATDYGSSPVRAVLVVKRPLDRLEQVIASNRESTLLIGSVTLAGLLLLGALFARVFGIGPRRDAFGTPGR